jgi:putative ATP-dependent endonuclease of OLD family
MAKSSKKEPSRIPFMNIRSLEVRRFRSIEKTVLTNCGGLNVLIGKNNAGKSNILSTIDLMYRHLSRATIAGPWNTPRPADEFTDRNCETPLQIGIEFDLPPHLNLSLRERLQSEAPHLEKSIEQIKTYNRLTFVLSGARKDMDAFLFIQRCCWEPQI